MLLAPRQKDDGGDASGGAIGGQGSRSIASRSAGHGSDRLAVGYHLLDHRDQHRHAQVFEGAGVAVATQLHPQVFHADLPPQSLGPEAIGVPFVHRDHVLIGHLGANPLFLAPHSTAIRPFVGADALIEEFHPGGSAARLQGLDIVLHIQ